jgi:UDP-N-acetylglucosamine 1-carboxyvinyltransferase
VERSAGVGSNMLTIEGVDYLGGTEHRMLPDMIEIGSFIGMAANDTGRYHDQKCTD